MERSDVVLVPEWSKSSTRGTSSHSGDHRVRPFSRHRTSLNAGNRDFPRSSSSTGSGSTGASASSSSRRRSVSSNSYTSTKSRPYRSFGQSRGDRNFGDYFECDDERQSLSVVNNGYSGYSYSFRIERDTLRQSNSIATGRQPESRPGKAENFDTICGIGKSSLEREFPSLRVEVMQCRDLRRITPAAESLPLGSSAIIGGNAWSSALIDLRATVGSDGPVVLNGQQNSAPASFLLTNNGLNMAETLAQAPTIANSISELSVESQKLEELAIKQSKQLIPLTPSIQKSLALKSLEKLKPKGARGEHISVLPNVFQQSSSQLANHNLRAPAKSHSSKTCQAGNFQVLNRVRNSLCPTSKEPPCLANANNVADPLVVAQSAAPPVKNTSNSKLKTDSKTAGLSLIQSSFIERRPSSQAQNRIDFFNSIRNKKSSNHSTSSQEQCPVMSSSISEMPCASVGQANDTCESNSILDSSSDKTESLNRINPSEEPISLPPDSDETDNSLSDPTEEEATFLRELGWDENATEAALTEEEIDDFNKKRELSIASKLGYPEIHIHIPILLPEGDAALSEL